MESSRALYERATQSASTLKKQDRSVTDRPKATTRGTTHYDFSLWVKSRMARQFGTDPEGSANLLIWRYFPIHIVRTPNETAYAEQACSLCTNG
jgi:hypothetical protein